MHTPQTQTPDPARESRALSNCFLVLHALAITALVFLRRDIGSRFLSLQAVLPIVIIPVFAACFSAEDPRPLLSFLPIYLVAVAVQRSRSHRRRHRETHSRSSGWPVLLTWPGFRTLTDEQARAAGEPLVVGLLGVVLATWSPPLGLYGVVVAASLFLTEGLRHAQERTRMQNTRDSLFEQRHFSRRIRRGRW